MTEQEYRCLESAILQATREDEACLMDLLQEASEKLSQEQFNLLTDKVLQIMSEAVREARGWRDESEEQEA